MKKLFAFLILALALPAFGQRVTLTVTVTNKAVTGDSITVNGGTRYFTNATRATTIATNLTSINATKTNLFNQFAAYPWSTLTLADGNTNSGSGTNALRLVGSAISASLSGGWGYLTLSTQAGSSTFPMLYPLANVVGETNRTNQASDVVAGLNSFATNVLATNAGPLGNYLTKGASTQQVVIAPVQFNGTLRAAGAVALTNGFTRAVTNINPVTSNLVNYGQSIRSEGSGGNSLQVGSNATASGSLSMAVGNSASATAANATALGVGSTATNTDATAVGSAAVAGEYGVAVGSGALATGTKATSLGWSANSPGNFATSIGNGSGANEDYAIAIGGGLVDAPNGIAIGNNAEAASGTIGSMAIGISAYAGHSNSLALGPQDHAGNAVTTTTTNQLRMGTANHSVSIPGQLLISGTQSNTTFTGTNLARGAWAYPRYDLTTLAAGNNLAVPVGTNRFVRVGSGPASAATIVGMVGGATSGGIDGQDVVLFNDSGYGLTFAVNSVDPVPANRINTPTATDVTVPDQGWAQFFYDGTDARWKLINAYSGTNLVATATNVTVTINTNGTSVGSSLTVNFTTGVTGYVSGGTINLGVSAAGGGGSSLVTNGNQFAATTTLNIKKAALVTNLISYVDSAAPALVLKAIDPTSTNIFEGRNLNDEVVTRLDGSGWLFSTATIEGYAYKSTSQTGSKVLATDGSGNFVETTTPTSTLAYITNVTSDIQAQLDAKATTNKLNGYVANNSGLATNLYVYGTTTNALRIASGVITSSLPAIDISQTWSNSGVTFTGLVFNATDTSSGTNTLIADFKLNGTSKLSVDKDGQLRKGSATLLTYGVVDAFTVEVPSSGFRAGTVSGKIYIGNDGLVVGKIGWGNTAIPNRTTATDLFLDRDAAATLQLGADAATATAQTLKAHDGSGTDKAGASLSINGGQSTGTGVGGALIKNTSLTGSTGSSANSYSVREYIYAGETTLTEGDATGFATIALPASKYAGVHVFLTTHADDATDFQATTDMFTVSAVAKGTNISSNVATPTQSTIGSTGTLTTAITVTSTTNNTFTINCNATSSLTQTTLKAKWQIRINSDAAATVTPL